jgi:hypothetical protein
MSEYYTARTGDGVQFPRSGPILSVLVETLGVRADIETAVREEKIGAKSVQRYFADTHDRIRAVGMDAGTRPRVASAESAAAERGSRISPARLGGAPRRPTGSQELRGQIGTMLGFGKLP